MHFDIYGIPNCNTVKKALSWLDQRQINYTFHNYKKEPPTAATIEHWLMQAPWTTLLNRSGMTWRKLDENTKLTIVDGATAIPFMITQPSAIKRPIIVDEKGSIQAIGFEEAAYIATFC